MLAEIIAIGDELTSGERLDTNSGWLSKELSRVGLTVRWHSSVGDDLQAIADVVKIALARADCLVLSGGLGPTADDLTRQAVALAGNVELMLNQQQLERIEQLFRRRGREMSQRNRVQAELPVGSVAIDNPHGSAPGIDLTVKTDEQRSSRLFALPGVPAEMKEMFRETVEPAVLSMLGDNVSTTMHHTLKCFGKGESDLEGMLPDLIRRGRDPQVGITVHQATITLRITAAGGSETECREKMQPTIKLIHEKLGDLVFGESDDELQHAAIRLLQETGKTVAVAESGSGGLLSQWLHEADREQESFKGGMVMVLRKHESPGGANHSVTDFTNASRQKSVADEMAEHVRRQFQADIGLALGAYPPAAAAEGATQYVGMALASDDASLAQAMNFAGHPDVRGPRAVKQALDMLRLHLRQLITD